MPTARREFIQRFGIMLASLLAARCAPVPSDHAATPTATPSPTATPTPTPRPPGTRPCFDWSSPHRDEWEGLRECWLDMEDIVSGVESPTDYPTDLEDAHRHILDALVEAGEIDVAVADQVQISFEAAAWHSWRSQAPILCYRPVYPLVLGPPEDMLRQRELLLGAANDLDQKVVEQAQAAIALDITFFEAIVDLQSSELEAEEKWEMWNKLENDFKAGDLKVSPEALEAACILVDLLLGEV